MRLRRSTAGSSISPERCWNQDKAAVRVAAVWQPRALGRHAPAERLGGGPARRNAIRLLLLVLG